MAQKAQREQFRDLVGSFATAMLVTHGEDGALRARPMSLASADEDGDLWFASGIDSGKINELLHDRRVAVVMQSASRFVSISGEAEVIVNAEKAAELWNEAFRPWYPKGPEDPELALVHVRTRDAEYWDLSGLRGVRYVFDAVKHVVRGERMSDEPAQHHGKVSLA
jgi:general stress protein 26